MSNLQILMSGISTSIIIELAKLSHVEVCQIASSDLSSIPEDWRDLAQAIQKMAITNSDIRNEFKAAPAKRA